MVNPFLDGELLPGAPAGTSDNPYVPPVVSGKGEYDWTLAKRIFMAVSALAFVYLLASAIGLWHSWDARTISAAATPMEQVKAFFFGWKPD